MTYSIKTFTFFSIITFCILLVTMQLNSGNYANHIGMCVAIFVISIVFRALINEEKRKICGMMHFLIIARCSLFSLPLGSLLLFCRSFY